MVTMRIAKIKATSTFKMRVAKITASGTNVNPKMRIAKITASGGVPLDIAAIPDQTVFAFDTVTIAVPNLSTFPPGVGFTWEQISGPTVAYSDNGDHISFTAPPAVNGTTIIFGVLAQIGNQQSAEVNAQVNVQPHIYWMVVGGVWVATQNPVTL